MFARYLPTLFVGVFLLRVVDSPVHDWHSRWLVVGAFPLLPSPLLDWETNIRRDAHYRHYRGALEMFSLLVSRMAISGLHPRPICLLSIQLCWHRASIGQVQEFPDRSNCAVVSLHRPAFFVVSSL